MDLLQLALNGVNALAEALSIAPSTLTSVEEEARKVRTAVAKTLPPSHEQGGKLAIEPKSAAAAIPPIEPVAVHTRSVKSATRNVFDPDLSPEAVRALTDARQAMVEERLAEIAEAREKQDRQSEDQQGARLKR